MKDHRLAARACAVAALSVAALGFGLASAQGAYLFSCEKNTVVVVDDATGTVTTHTTIQAAIDAAAGSTLGSSSGDTVIVCPGEYAENIDIPQADSNDNTNLSVRSFKGPDETTIIGDLSSGDPVVHITANGIHFGGAGLGFTILGTGTPTTPEAAGIQVGVPDPVDLDESDDQELQECPLPAPIPDPLPDPPDELRCNDEEKPPLPTSNVTVAGNRVEELVAAGYEGTISGIAVNNTNNTQTFRNLVDGLTGAGLVYGIRYGDTNSKVDILQNAVKKVSQEGGTCPGPDMSAPTVGAIGLASDDEALNSLMFNNLVERVSSSCVAIGAYSDAFGGLENDRNGQQIPIATDIVNNKIKEVEGAQASAGIVLASVLQTNSDGDEVAPPSSFRVSTNDLPNNGTAVAVLTQLAPYTYIEQNNFDNNEVGVFNAGDENLDATNNWWGCAEGPESGKGSCATIVTVAPGTTNYQPPTKNHIDHAGSHAGDHAGKD